MNATRALFSLVLLLAAILFATSLYTLNETEQVIITQFGEPVGDAVTQAGLHFKLPWPIHEVHRFDKRWLPWDGDANQIPTKDKKFIWVDTYARWRIEDPLQFFVSVTNERQAQSRIDDIIDGQTRNAVASFDLIEIVRATDREFAVTEVLVGMLEQEAPTQIESGRDEITRRILASSSAAVRTLGIELVDVQFKRINYTEEVRESVYQRMISERKRIAERSRSEGLGRSAEIRGQKDRDLQRIESEAFRTAEETRGVADAEAIRIYARAYSKDPDFYQFLKTLETYRTSLDKDVTLLLSSSSEFFSFLNKSQ
ncbi:MAG: protease modulator HflC [Acidobacteria bacterium]|nr:MAG: protease modulator HflC [Acidobacteriota bacterium]